MIVTMTNGTVSDAIEIVRYFAGEKVHYNPIKLCEQLGIEVITNKMLNKDGYLVCGDGLKMVWVSSKIQNKHRQEFVVAHEVGHFLMHQEQMHCCSNISIAPTTKVGSSRQEREANSFATELLMPANVLAPLLPNGSLCFSDISRIADFFDVSMSHAAIKCIQNSKAENEILLCYDAGKLKWAIAKEQRWLHNKLPVCAPMDFANITRPLWVKGVWDSVYKGSVYKKYFIRMEINRWCSYPGI